jgi:multidrug efflux pump subunit AcrB
VTTVYPGASSAVVDGTVAQPIEAQLVGVDKMMYMKSVSGDDGSYTLTASFELGTDPDINTVNVNNWVQTALSSLPQDVQRQGVTVKKQSSALLGAIAFYSPKHSHDPLFLSNYVTINVLDRIKSTPGVGDAILWGPQDYAMRAWIQTDRLTGLGLTVGDIISAIQSQNTQAAVGRIGARPISDDQQLQLNIQTKGRLASVAEFEKIIIRANPDGSVLRLCAMARFELGAANLDRDTRFNGAPAAVVAIFQTPGANAIKTLNDVRARVAELAQSFPEDMTWKVTYDPSPNAIGDFESLAYPRPPPHALVLTRARPQREAFPSPWSIVKIGLDRPTPQPPRDLSANSPRLSSSTPRGLRARRCLARRANAVVAPFQERRSPLPGERSPDPTFYILD